jgi:hypothetical protein
MKKVIVVLSLLLCIAGVIHAQDSLKVYTGRYIMNEGAPVPDIEIVFEGGVLTAKSAQGDAELEKTSTSDEFKVPLHNGIAKFLRGAANKITGIRVEIGTMVLEGTKEPTPDTPKQEINPHELIHPKRLVVY